MIQKPRQVEVARLGGVTKIIEHPPVGRRTEVQEPRHANLTVTAYDVRDRVGSVTDPAGNGTTCTYCPHTGRAAGFQVGITANPDADYDLAYPL